MPPKGVKAVSGETESILLSSNRVKGETESQGRLAKALGSNWSPGKDHSGGAAAQGMSRVAGYC